MLRRENYWKKTHGISTAHLRKLFYAKQDQRCAICGKNVEFMGKMSCYDKQTDSVICRSCIIAVGALRKVPKLIRAKLLEFVDKKVDGNDTDNKTQDAGQSPETCGTI